MQMSDIGLRDTLQRIVTAVSSGLVGFLLSLYIFFY